MTSGSFSDRPTGPLNIGNVVSTALAIYRSRFKDYLGVSAIAHLWSLVPVYGWAKYFAHSASLARLAFAEISGKPESSNSAKSAVNDKLWTFILISLTVGLYMFGWGILLYLATAIVGGIAIAVGSLLGPVGAILGGIILVAAVLALFAALLWLGSRWFVAEVPAAVDVGTQRGDSVKRSWDLSQSSVWRIVGILCIAFLVTLPAYAVTSYPLQIVMQFVVEQGTAVFWLLYFANIIVSLIIGTLFLPFWQSLKGVIYYDLCSRREGLDLKLQDRD